MTKLSLSLTGFIVVATAMLAPSLTARTQSANRFEYLRLSSYSARVQALGRVEFRSGYRACDAATPNWTCRDFEPTESSATALSTALATLGTEGWELVSALDEDPESSYAKRLMYLFKRPVP
jgi:hypothetical protein